MAKKKRAPLLDDRPPATAESLAKAAADQKEGTEKYLLRLYVTGTTRQSARAIEEVKKTCEQYLRGRYELKVIDVYQQPKLARGEQIVAAPTLVKKLPLPLRRLIGDMTDRQRLLSGLDISVEVDRRVTRAKSGETK